MANETGTDEERAAMKAHADEQKKAAKRKGAAGKKDDSADVLAAIEKMAPKDKAIGERLHALIMEAAPDLAPRTWYGMPAYALDGKVVLHFQESGKFKTRYLTLGFSDRANLDDGEMWPTSYAIDELTEEAERRVSELVRRAVS